MLRRLGSMVRRNVFPTMATPDKAPAEPLVVVLGSTGTGKSELAVELATRFKGEIINTDAMQLYSGLPIITNKIAPAEQRGIRHHLLGHISLDEAPWDVDEFKREARKVISDIRARGKLPILVGGTHYYIDPLLFKDVILDDVQMDYSRSYPILQQCPEVMLEELRRVDPVMAEKWHPNDVRKIRHSLEIFLRTGRPASEHYAEQRERKREEVAREPWNTLLFWVYSDRDVLRERLDRRVDKMMEAGLLNEVQELFEFKRARAAAGHIIDMTKGIWQSIGYKEFEPFLTAVDEGKPAAELEKLKSEALTDMQTATRQYANVQTRWIRTKQIPRLRDQGPTAVQSLYLVDSTDVSQFQANVTAPATMLAEQFLHGEPRASPTELSDVARDVLTRVAEPPPIETPRKRTCEVCSVVTVTEEGWQKHIRGRNHKRTVQRKRRLALVPVEDARPAPRDSGRVGSESEDSLPDVASMFIATSP